MNAECCTLGEVVTGTDAATNATAQSASSSYRRGGGKECAHCGAKLFDDEAVEGVD